MMKVPPFLQKRSRFLECVYVCKDLFVSSSLSEIFLPHESQLIFLSLMNYVLEDYRLILLETSVCY